MSGRNTRNDGLKRPLLQGLFGGSVIGLFVGCTLVVAEYTGLYVTRFWWIIIVGIFLVFAPVFVLQLLLAVIRRFRPAAVRFLSAEFGMLTVLGAVGLPSVNLAHSMALDHEMQHARAVIQALKAYQVEKLSPATELGQLTPKYFTSSPMPVRGYCHYSYEITEYQDTAEDSRDRSNLPNGQESWQFSIWCLASGIFEIEVLVYRPDNRYEVNEDDGYVWMQHPVGDWMYYYLRL